MGVYLGLLIGFFIGGIVLLGILVANNSQRHHNKHHTHYTELMCNFCVQRKYYSGYSLSEVLRRWPMRIFGEAPPRGEG